MIIENKIFDRKSRCKYCYRFGHSDQECPDKMQKRSPAMSGWGSKMTCAKCNKKGFFAFNCPPKYNNKARICNKRNLSSYNSEDKSTIQNEQAVYVNEFAGYTHQILHKVKRNKNSESIQKLFTPQTENFKVL